MNKRVALIIGCVLLIIIYIFKSPENIDREYDGFILSHSNESINKNIKVSLKGELQKNILLQDRFNGEVIIGESKMKIETYQPSTIQGWIKNFTYKIKNSHIMLQGNNVNDNQYIETSGVIYISDNFEELWGFSKSLRDKYNIEDVLIVAPADNKKEAMDIFEKKEEVSNLHYSSINNN
ncbi:hypothetical protein GOQ27_02305 [Clostridium sp. D2Q-11]|uniref:Uncharacterized protein n=1 Tax=Anaeromonas frigoriresistens TaxID=2683708 RepID=A0A942UQD7_9FIRM|nr:hypothetical protein [Anaeromonas frigoriresistens]MBS4537273.1 hypothetical protein [Anaeromonas frigoriresistens]